MIKNDINLMSIFMRFICLKILVNIIIEEMRNRCEWKER